MLNDIIKIDLHIHSSYSKYKDKDIVKKSTIDNLDTLISKLNENKISLCSITDHNRFNYNLYSALKSQINSNIENSYIKNNLPGIEFDVVLEKNKPKCHIVAIFNDSDDNIVKEIEQRIRSVRLLTEPSDAYTLNEFEKILKAIGLDTILIVHQRQSLKNNTSNTNSLSNATSEPSAFLQVGFIDCLEYNRPKVEGIIKSSLRDVNLSFPIITGSDCHDWECYPYHDEKAKGVERDFTQLKCLPTFKGLLMAITSFTTRANRNINSNKHYIKSFSINGVDYPLVNGINVIIGDNGSGKSLLASTLAGCKEKYYAGLIKDNEINVKYNDNTSPKNNINYVKQGEIIERVRSGNLFEGNNSVFFEEINTKDLFSNAVKSYFNDIRTYVQKNIQKHKSLNSLSEQSLALTPVDKSFYYPVISTKIDPENTDDDKARLSELAKIIHSLEIELQNNSKYYKERNILDKIQKALVELMQSYEIILDIYNRKELDNKVRGIIRNKLSDLKAELLAKRTSEEARKTRIIESYNNFKNSVVDCIKLQQDKNIYPTFPTKIKGISTNEYKGYVFCKTAKYNDLDLKDDFYDYCFNKNYKTEASIKQIETEDEFSEALSGYNCLQLNEFVDIKIGGFIREYSKETTTISEISSNSNIGNTPGEVSLVYYKFTIQETDEDYNILIIDQPEDDINPSRIKSYLNSYLGSIRDEKQVILVTHSPLLVVNLDVDNVIYLTKKNDVIEVKNGALEYEDDNYSILNLVKENLDGGYEAIERRLKAYGQDKN